MIRNGLMRRVAKRALERKPLRRIEQGGLQRRLHRLGFETLEVRMVLSTAVSWAVDTSGSWDNPNNWSGGEVPGSRDDVVINRSVPVTVTIGSAAESIHSLTVASNETLVLSGGSLAFAAPSEIDGPFGLDGGTLDLNAPLTLTATSTWTGGTISGNGTLTNNGAITLTPTALNDAVVQFNGNVTIAGSAQLIMGPEVNGNYVIAYPTSGSTVTNAAGHMIKSMGAGYLGHGPGTVVNQGTLVADGSGAGITIDSTSATNSGTWSALNKGAIGVDKSITVNNTGGVIEADGASVFYNGGTVSGGELKLTNQSIIAGSGALANITLPAGSDLLFPSNGADQTFTGTVTNNGTIELRSSVEYQFAWQNGLSLEGTGQVLIDSGSGYTVLSALDSSALTIGSGQTLLSMGGAYLSGSPGSVVNQGLIEASGSGAYILMDPAQTTNDGTIEAVASAQIDILTPLDNTHGVIHVDSGTFENKSTVSGGSLILTDRSSVGGGGTLANITIPVGSDLLFSPEIGGETLTGLVTNDGTIELSSSEEDAFAWQNGLTLQGKGQVLIDPGSGYTVISALDNSTLTIASGQTVLSMGGAYLGNSVGSVVNQGLVEAKGKGSYIVFNAPQTTNDGTMEAESGAQIETLRPLDNSQGVIQADSGALYNTSTISGGSLILTDKSSVGGGGTLANITIPIGSDLLFSSGQTLTGLVTNDGTIELGSSGASAFDWQNGLTLQGAGQVVVDPGSAYTVISALDNSMLTIGAQQTVLSLGGVYLGNSVGSVVNQGLVEAKGKGSYVVFNAPQTTNDGTMEAESGAQIQTLRPLGNSQGVIQADSGALYNTSTISGGSLILTDKSSVGGGGTLANITIPASSDLLVLPENGSVVLTGTVTNDGTIELQSSLDWQHGLTLQGAGQVVIDPGSGYTVISALDNSMLTIGAQQTVLSTGGAYLGNSVGSVVNLGLVEAKGSGSYIIFNSSKTTNNGTMSAQGGGLLEVLSPLNNEGTLDANGGPITVSGTVAQVSGTTLTGGTWNAVSAGAINLPSADSISAIDANVTLEGPGSTFAAINGITTNTGSLSILDGANFTTTDGLSNAGSLDIGAASVVIVDGNYSQSATGALEVEVGGPSSSGQFGRLNASGKATLNGALNINLTGLGIVKGDSFPIMGFSSRQGTFATITGLMAGRSQVLEVAQNASNVTVDVLSDTAALSVTSVTFVPARDMPGEGVTVTYTVANTEDTPTTIDSWYDSIYLDSGTTITPSSQLIGRVLHTGVVDGLGTYTGTLTASLPGEVPGSYHILVLCDSRGLVPDFNRTQDVGASSSTIALSIPAIAANTPTSGTIDNGQDEYFSVDLPAGRAVRVSAGFSVAAGAEMFVGYQEVPNADTYDEYAFNPSVNTQQILLTDTQAGTYYIVLQGEDGAGAGQAFTLTAQELSVAILGVSPSQGGNAGPTTVTIQGSELTPGTSVSLVDSGGSTLEAESVFFQNSSTLSATVDLTGLSVGRYDVRINDQGQTDTDAGAFTVTTGGGGDVVYNMSAPDFVRDGTMGTVTMTYDNIGTSDAQAPLLAVIGTNALVRLPDESDFAGSTAQFLAINSSGPAGILPPGTINHITLYFEASTTAPVGSQISFELGLAATDQPIDWASDEQNLQPPSVSSVAWPFIWSNFLASVGTTAGDLQTALDADADYLSQFGEYNANVTPLISFELQKADDFGAISQRYNLGAFGLGWPDPTNLQAVTDSLGDVTIESSGQVRTFFIQPDGSYQGAPGDAATLTLQNGVYTLRETDGSLTVFNPNGSLNYTEDTNHNKITANYTNGLLTSLVDSTGDTVSFAYNAQGRVPHVTDPVGRVTAYSYDATGKLLMSVADETGTTMYTYGRSPGAVNADALSSIAYPDGTHTDFTYNSQGQLASESADNGAEMITYSYDEGGVSVKDADGGTSTYFLNEFEQVARYVGPLGNITDYAYDANQNLVQETGPDGLTTTFANNAAGDTTSATDPSGDSISASYGALFNNLTSLADPNGNTTQYKSDSNGNLMDITYPDSTQQQFTYDPTGNLIESVDQNGNATNYIYYSNNLLKEEDFADGSKITFAYDAHRNLMSATNSVGTTSFQYNSADELTEVTYPNGMYLKFRYNDGGQRIQTVDQTGFTVNYRYDAVGRLWELTDGNNNLIVQYTYDPAGRLIEKNLGNGTYTTYSYDLAGDLKSIVNYEPNGTVQSSYDYDYNALGLPVSLTTSVGTTTYGYDTTGQLTSVELPGGTTITYQYDAAGNRVAVTDNGVTTNYTTNNMNEYTKVGSTTYMYDKDGNLISSTDSSGTTTYTSNDVNELVSVVSPQGTWTYQYDAVGNLIADTQNGQETQYLIDPTGIGNVVGTFDGSGNVIDHYTQGLGLTSQVDATGGAAYYNFDLTGNTTELTGANGVVLNTYSYLPSGEQLSASGSTRNPFTYVGRFSVLGEGSGQYFMRSRRYQSSLGRFSQPDPIGVAGGIDRYTYAGNLPTVYVDPVGLAPTQAQLEEAIRTLWSEVGKARTAEPYNPVAADADHYFQQFVTAAYSGDNAIERAGLAAGGAIIIEPGYVGIKLLDPYFGSFPFYQRLEDRDDPNVQPTVPSFHQIGAGLSGAWDGFAHPFGPLAPSQCERLRTLAQGKLISLPVLFKDL
jgi:RHS repeat-associated protein